MSAPAVKRDYLGLCWVCDRPQWSGDTGAVGPSDGFWVAICALCARTRTLPAGWQSGVLCRERPGKGGPVRVKAEVRS